MNIFEALALRGILKFSRRLEDMEVCEPELAALPLPGRIGVYAFVSELWGGLYVGEGNIGDRLRKHLTGGGNKGLHKALQKPACANNTQIYYRFVRDCKSAEELLIAAHVVEYEEYPKFNIRREPVADFATRLARKLTGKKNP